MSGACSKETLALYVEGDLPDAAALQAASHLSTCGDCRRFLEELRARQSLLKSLRRESVSPAECAGMRRDVMTIVREGRDGSGWALRLERALVFAFQRRPYAVAALVVCGVVSVSVFAHVRSDRPDASSTVAVFDARATLRRPTGYRDWILVNRADRDAPRPAGHDGRSTGTSAPARVYINPAAYREYAKTGKFPEGTMMVWEAADDRESADHRGQSAPQLLASVKDRSRFEGGWGFFNFSGRVAAPAAKAAESSGCRDCHRRDAESDHVFTQFYPALRSALRGAELCHPPERMGDRALGRNANGGARSFVT